MKKMTTEKKKEVCSLQTFDKIRIRERIPGIVRKLVKTCDSKECYDHVSPEAMPSREAIINIIHRVHRILYPGYFTPDCLDHVNLNFFFGQEVTELFELLSKQITLSIRHDCLRYDRPCTKCQEQGWRNAVNFLNELPVLRKVLATDVQATLEGDPAAKSYDEIIFSYPGLFAITVYRIAHQLYCNEVSLIPRIMSEYAHGKTGIDIHPGASIEESFFIDHGTGVVIGETTEIGKRVRLYQGVTLGALSVEKNMIEKLRNTKRHPTIEDDVIVYSGATILGGGTVIGARSVIGGNVWLTESVPPDTSVFMKKPELIFKGQNVDEKIKI